MHESRHVNNRVQELDTHVDDLHNRDIDHQATPALPRVRMEFRLMVGKGALPSTRASGTSEHEPAPATWTEMRKETRALLLFLFLVHVLSHHLLLLQAAAQPAEDLMELPSAKPHKNLRHKHIHELLRRRLMSAQRRWIKVRTQFRPRVRTFLRTFFPSEKSAKNPLPNVISSSNVR